MNDDSDWNYGRSRTAKKAGRGVGLGAGMLRVTLLFGTAAVALALFATPYLAGEGRQQLSDARYGGLDFMSTGSVASRTYTERRSVLQKSPGAVCIIRADGARSGDC